MGTSAVGEPPVLRCERLVRSFVGQKAVDGLSLEVRGGELVGLLGANGAGKTTTLRMVAGLLTPDSGTVHIAGKDVFRAPLEARRHLGFLTASTGLYERLTPREMLQTFGRLQGLEGKVLAARIDELAQELSLTSFLDRKAGQLSSGQRQRTSIARAVVHDPLLYVLDEPTSALDPLAAQEVSELALRAKARGKAVVFSTHRMEEAELLCDRICFLRAGRIVAEGTAESLRAQSKEKSLVGAFLHYARGGER